MSQINPKRASNNCLLYLNFQDKFRKVSEFVKKKMQKYVVLKILDNGTS